MQILCPQHKLPLEVEECTIHALGADYPITIGRCPSCRALHVNRMIFPNCTTFQVDGHAYQYNEALHAAYPPRDLPATPRPSHDEGNAKAPTPKKERKETKKEAELRRKKEKEEARKKEKKEAHIRKMQESLRKGNYSEYPVNIVRFIKNVPLTCTVDGDELVAVKRVTFRLYGAAFKTPARCCVRCNAAYLPLAKRAELQEKANALNHITKAPSTKQVALKWEISHTLRQIPILNHDDTHCPFCKNQFSSINVRYAFIDFSGKISEKQAALQGCMPCNAVFAHPQQILAIKKNNSGKTIHTLSPSNYQTAKAMMEATKLSPQEEVRTKIPLPYEDLPDETENISRTGKVVQVYANKCHCQKCHNRYQRITTVNHTAVVDTVDGKTTEVNVMFCKGCGQYFISMTSLKWYKSLYGGLLIECKVPSDFSLSQFSWFDFAPDSVLSRCGYTVKEGVSREHRQAILRYILEAGKAEKYEIIEKINSFIYFREHSPKYDGACQRWREDIKFVNEYNLHQQKKVYGLEFKPAGSLKQK